MNTKKMQSRKEILIPKGFEPEDFIDTDDTGFDFEEPILTEEVDITFERNG